MIYMRGQSRDYDRWAERWATPAWRWEQCLPAFLAHEDHWRGASAVHAAPGFDPRGTRAGASGGSSASACPGRSWTPSQAAEEAGIPATEDFNRGNNEGVGYFEVNQRSGWRWNAAKAFLKPALRDRRQPAGLDRRHRQPPADRPTPTAPARHRVEVLPLAAGRRWWRGPGRRW
jgi:choline dehydrogenase